MNSRSLSVAASLSLKFKKRKRKKKGKKPFSHAAAPPLCLTLSGSINDQMEAICVTMLTAVTGWQLAAPTLCIQMSRERPRKGGGQGWRDGGKEEGVETVQLVMCSCPRGWIRPRSLAVGGERKRTRMEGEAEGRGQKRRRGWRRRGRAAPHAGGRGARRVRRRETKTREMI